MADELVLHVNHRTLAGFGGVEAAGEHAREREVVRGRAHHQQVVDHDTVGDRDDVGIGEPRDVLVPGHLLEGGPVDVELALL